ncbi:MAG: E3 binding domain-containing protein, partial [Chloroflexota bacterium]|nr:E3 binding domain-containing protein [Chloroflexota bacterium]
KINAEVEAPASGRLTHVQAQAGDSVKVIGLLALIAAPEDTDADLAAAVEAAQAAAERGTAASQAVATSQPTRRPPPRARPQRPGRPAPPAAAGGRVMASPVARRLARELQVDLSTVTGTGPRGRIVESDVRAAAEASAAAPAAAESTDLTAKQVIPVSGIRQVIGERMSTSLRDMAQLTIFTEADATALRDRRAALAQEAAAANGPRPTYNDLIVWHREHQVTHRFGR